MSLKEIRNIINEILDRKARYGGKTYLIQVRMIHREVKKKSSKKPNQQQLTRTIVEELQKRGAKQWGHLWENDSYNRQNHPLNQIYQIGWELI